MPAHCQRMSHDPILRLQTAICTVLYTASGSRCSGTVPLCEAMQASHYLPDGCVRTQESMHCAHLALPGCDPAKLEDTSRQELPVLTALSTCKVSCQCNAYDTASWQYTCLVWAASQCISSAGMSHVIICTSDEREGAEVVRQVQSASSKTW